MPDTYHSAGDGDFWQQVQPLLPPSCAHNLPLWKRDLEKLGDSETDALVGIIVGIAAGTRTTIDMIIPDLQAAHGPKLSQLLEAAQAIETESHVLREVLRDAQAALDEAMVIREAQEKQNQQDRDAADKRQGHILASFEQRNREERLAWVQEMKIEREHHRTIADRRIASVADDALMAISNANRRVVATDKAAQAQRFTVWILIGTFSLVLAGATGFAIWITCHATT